MMGGEGKEEARKGTEGRLVEPGDVKSRERRGRGSLCYEVIK